MLAVGAADDNRQPRGKTEVGGEGALGFARNLMSRGDIGELLDGQIEGRKKIRFPAPSADVIDQRVGSVGRVGDECAGELMDEVVLERYVFCRGGVLLGVILLVVEDLR